MMAMLPLRSVIAFDQSSCEMHDQVSMEVDHSAHSMHAMSDAAQPGADESNNCCCCDSDMKCFKHPKKDIINFIENSVGISASRWKFGNNIAQYWKIYQIHHFKGHRTPIAAVFLPMLWPPPVSGRHTTTPPTT